MIAPSARHAVLALALLTLASPAAAQTWITAQGVSDETGSDVVELPGGGFLALGTERSLGAGDGDFWVLELDALGVVLSGRTYGGALLEEANAIDIAPDGGAILVGTTRSFGADTAGDWWIVRLDAAGAILWQVRYGGPSRDVAWAVVATPDGGCVVTGSTVDTIAAQQLLAVARFDGTGALTWSKGYTIAQENAIGRAIRATPGGGFVVAGLSGRTQSDAWVLQLDAAGTGAVTWQSTYALGDEDEEAFAVQPLSDGYLVFADTRIQSADQDWWILRLELDGSIRWHARRGSLGYEQAKALAQTTDGGFLLGGEAQWSGPGPTPDAWLVKLAADGAVEWEGLAPFAKLSGIRPLADGGSVVVGTGRDASSMAQTLQVARLDAAGLAASPCFSTSATASVDTAVAPRVQSPSVTVRDLTWPVVTTSAAIATATAPLACAACPPLSCDSISATPASACPGEPITFAVEHSGGQGSVMVEWDFDEDGNSDASGDVTVRVLPVGPWIVTARVSDECLPRQACELQVAVATAAPPSEVDDVLAGAPPLRVLPGGTRLIVESVAAATAYNAYVDRLGSWYFPTPATGSACTLRAWTDNGDGTLTLDLDWPVASWVDVTASDRCAEGPVGRDAFGARRTDTGAWSRCGAAP